MSALPINIIFAHPVLVAVCASGNAICGVCLDLLPRITGSGSALDVTTSFYASCFDGWIHGLDFGKVKQAHVEDGAVAFGGGREVR